MLFLRLEKRADVCSQSKTKITEDLLQIWAKMTASVQKSNRKWSFQQEGYSTPRMPAGTKVSRCFSRLVGYVLSLPGGYDIRWTETGRFVNCPLKSTNISPENFDAWTNKYHLKINGWKSPYENVSLLQFEGHSHPSTFASQQYSIPKPRKEGGRGWGRFGSTYGL